MKQTQLSAGRKWNCGGMVTLGASHFLTVSTLVAPPEVVGRCTKGSAGASPYLERAGLRFGEGIILGFARWVRRRSAKALSEHSLPVLDTKNNHAWQGDAPAEPSPPRYLAPHISTGFQNRQKIEVRPVTLWKQSRPFSGLFKLVENRSSQLRGSRPPL